MVLLDDSPLLGDPTPLVVPFGSLDHATLEMDFPNQRYRLRQH